MNVEPPQYVTMADVLQRLGNVPAERVRLTPHPGTATEADVLRLLEAADKRICELVDGVLVEKAVGFYESQIAGWLIYHLYQYLVKHPIGSLGGAAGLLHLLPDCIRGPDVSFISSAKLPVGKPPSRPIPDLVPDLAVEVLSKSNTPGEMKRKLREYFHAGVALVWLIQPKNHTVRVHTSATQSVLLQETDTLDGGAVLPGFSLPVRTLFSPGGAP